MAQGQSCRVAIPPEAGHTVYMVTVFVWTVVVTIGLALFYVLVLIPLAAIVGVIKTVRDRKRPEEPNHKTPRHAFHAAHKGIHRVDHYLK